MLDLRCAFGVPVARPPTKSLDLSLTLTNNVIHVNDVPEHLLTMYPVCTIGRSLLSNNQAYRRGLTSFLDLASGVVLLGISHIFFLIYIGFPTTAD